MRVEELVWIDSVCGFGGCVMNDDSEGARDVVEDEEGKGGGGKLGGPVDVAVERAGEADGDELNSSSSVIGE